MFDLKDRYFWFSGDRRADKKKNGVSDITEFVEVLEDLQESFCAVGSFLGSRGWGKGRRETKRKSKRRKRGDEEEIIISQNEQLVV